MRSIALGLVVWVGLVPSLAFADDPPKWDVNAPPGPIDEAPIDVTEGTWMCIDVAPDGKTLVFDLLGDLYELPIEGGDAKPLTSGMAWDMQPRISPDGTQIAFTSDRSGGDNLWVMRRDGSEPKAISKETFRLVSSPCWTPDGRAIVGRKHFTAHRSLGAGEMWLYHLAGGDGLQLTNRPSEEKDVGECVHSPDGAFLWYSLDATPGGSFQYNKDSNAGIYAIQRLDLLEGDTDTVLSGPGGACRPTPSPDGKSLAFIRRVRFKTTLQLLDLASGEIRMLADDLERDHQETWAIFGTYPTIDWTPDGKELVFWARGKLWRQDVTTLERREIPFRVTSTRKRSAVVRRKHAVAPDTFDVKMLRSVRVSPRGDVVVYQALGRLWVRALPDGTPRRLTTQEADFEFFPSWSRDGKSIAYVSWNDDTLGVVRILDVNGAATSGEQGRAITREPGHYADPVLSPDGRHLVYGKRSGGGLVASTWSNEPGLYVFDLAGGEARLISTIGTNPFFGPESDRVYLRTDEESNAGDKHTLISIDLVTKEMHTHATSENATEFALSPDGNWLAFRERFNVYITPFARTGRAIAVAPKMTSQPVARASKDSGENLQWSGDSTTLYWSLGPELFERKITDAFQFLAGAPATLPEPATTGRNIAFQARQSAPQGVVVYTNARIVTMRGDEVLENGSIVVDGNRIRAIGTGKATTDGATYFDCGGKTITPGFLDVHAHGGQSADGITPQRNWGQYANLAFGVTTIHDPSNDTNAIFAAAELQKAGSIVAPRIFSTGTILYGAAGSDKSEIESLDDARMHLRRMKAVGAFSVKSYNQPRRDQRQQVIAAARELDMLVVPEGGSTFPHNLTMVVDGHTGIEHTLSVEKIYADVTQLWKGSGVGLTPTLIVGYGGIWGENYWYAKTNVWENERLLTFVPRSLVDPRSRRRFTAPDEEWNHVNCARICKALVDVGERVQLGAHGQLAGLGAHWELWMLGQGGLAPMQALRAATLDGARYIGVDDDLGSIEPGKLADFLVFDADPLADLSNTSTLTWTVQNGVVYDARTMRRVPLGSEGETTEPPKFPFQNGLAPAQDKHVHAGACSCDATRDSDGGVSGYR
ncbi:MAG: PD40 domain-containing protein [Planctomycetes bacterium]|nr:PD40 domain-containing protein [Planctomycetota bacterium]MCC7169371.1 PD40 domain-containing protein [Planctomycetota bacterium]